MKRTVIVGNGFIHHLRCLLQSDIDNKYQDNVPSYLNKLNNELQEVTRLFNRFNSLEGELRSLLNAQDISLEEVYQLVDDVVSWYQTRSAHKDLDSTLAECINQINVIGDRLIREQIVPITEGFEEQEIKGVYKYVTKWLGTDIGDAISQKLKKNKDQLGVFTTNYDGFLEQVLRTKDGRGFLLKDGFAGSPDRPKTLYDDYFSKNKFMGHLHSSYKFGWNGKDWVKYSISRETRNRNPLIVYMNPKQKLDFIRRNEVLRKYWRHFERWIQKSDEVIIYGNSLASDPHIRNAVGNCSKEAKIYVFDVHYQAVKRQVENNLDNQVSCMSTANINLERLSDIFSSPSNL